MNIKSFYIIYVRMRNALINQIAIKMVTALVMENEIGKG